MFTLAIESAAYPWIAAVDFHFVYCGFCSGLAPFIHVQATNAVSVQPHQEVTEDIETNGIRSAHGFCVGIHVCEHSLIVRM